ncbi:hypothetical protein HU200_050225 [Digitaria exilis]|uniref:DUF6598 domain-containing protein n=1 Tax=Digitaria exilis TaxID=1010633 RepID=A0A835EAH8_9POAL|nr:hypothetical protein HU200_050225 [Digitaria exilis]
MSNNNITPLPPCPLRILPNVTTRCVSGHECYHRQYWTDSPATTAPAHPYFRPCRMMQVFSLRLPRTFAYPVQIYGTFAVRNCWEPLCNYVFNRTRDDPATIMPGCSSLPLCGPCRGIYVLKHVLVDIDLWIKEEGEMSANKQLFRGYLEFDADLSGPKSKLSDAIETAIEVFAVAKHSLDVKMRAFTGSFDDEVVLYDGTLCASTKVINHFVAVRKQDELHVSLQLHGSQYRWIFKVGVGVLVAPDHGMYDFARFVVKVDFRTQGRAASAWEWSFSDHKPDFMMWGSRQVPTISVDMERQKSQG